MFGIDGLDDSEEENEWMEEEEESLHDEDGGTDTSISIETLESDDDEELNNVKNNSHKSKYQDMEID